MLRELARVPPGVAAAHTIVARLFFSLEMQWGGLSPWARGHLKPCLLVCFLGCLVIPATNGVAARLS